MYRIEMCTKTHFHRDSLLMFLLLSLLLLPLLVLMQFPFPSHCLFLDSLSVTIESCGCTFFVDLCDSRVAAGAAVGSLMPLPINNQCPPPLPEREFHKACQPIKICFIPCTALSLHKPVQPFKKTGWGSRGGGGGG